MQHLVAACKRMVPAASSFHCCRRSISLKADGYPQDFIFFPDFFSIPEQRVLLSAALKKLDRTEPMHYRRRRKEFLASSRAPQPENVQSIFLPDEYYNFEPGHFDGVIKNYREMHVSAWPDEPELQRLLERLHAVHPSQPTQMHILHLASDGEIYPHVDNLDASGSWILGVSLGNTRALRLECATDPSDSFDMLLPSGSVYIQSDTIRYRYKHSIFGKRKHEDTEYGGGQRLSIMIRDKHTAHEAILGKTRHNMFVRYDTK